jgi:6 kDa early secretory antigenic target
MAVYSVDSDAVISATTAVNGTAESIRSDAQAMLSHLTQLQASWTGAASVAFQGVMDRWRLAHQQMNASLVEIGGALAAAGRQYAETEQASAALFR